MKGSAGSGKSVNIAQDFVAKLSDPAFQGANLLVVRKIEETNRDSTFAELQAAIYRMFGPYADRFWKVNLNPLALECRTTGNRIIFRGVKDQRQREKVKSITFKNGKLVWIWCEEATELLSEDVDILDDRLRGNLDDLNPNLFYQITMTFNPVSATHWIKARYFDKADPDVLTHHSTYKTNRFIDPAYFRRMERRKEEDPEGYGQGHTSQQGWNPSLTPALWSKVGDPAEEWPAWSQPLGAHDAYNAGDKVSHNGKAPTLATRQRRGPFLFIRGTYHETPQI